MAPAAALILIWPLAAETLFHCETEHPHTAVQLQALAHETLHVQGHCTKYTKRNLDIHPFEVGGETKLEHFARKSDCGLVVYANHAKKRPHNLTLGRFYDGQVLDLLELGVDAFRSIKEFAASGASKVQSSNKVSAKFSHAPGQLGIWMFGLLAASACQHLLQQPLQPLTAFLGAARTPAKHKHNSSFTVPTPADFEPMVGSKSLVTSRSQPYRPQHVLKLYNIPVCVAALPVICRERLRKLARPQAGQEHPAGHSAWPGRGEPGPQGELLFCWG